MLSSKNNSVYLFSIAGLIGLALLFQLGTGLGDPPSPPDAPNPPAPPEAVAAPAAPAAPISFAEVCGQIIDAETSEEVIGASIHVEENPNLGTATDLDGKFCLTLSPGAYSLKIVSIGYESKSIGVRAVEGRTNLGQIALQNSAVELNSVEVTVMSKGSRKGKKDRYRTESIAPSNQLPPPPPPMEMIEEPEEDFGVISYDIQLADRAMFGSAVTHQPPASPEQQFNTESYDHIQENEFKGVVDNPLSTFSIDVDAASYANVRRFIDYGTEPPKDAVRIEELVNYFTYEYPQPEQEHPFAVITEVSETPWNSDTRLVHIGLQGKSINYEEADPSNLVFLIDVSGSMSSSNKLGLVKSSLSKLVDQLSEKDRVAIVVYAGAAGAVLPSTPGSEKKKIKDALNRLSAGGSTAGGAGIKLAYDIASQYLIEDGNNRVILCTDGDFNIGASSDSEMTRLIEEKRKSGIYITVCGFGMGNYKDSKMEKIADHGNGNYYYIDREKEAHKVFVTEMRSTLFTIAKDVKIQIEFNPAVVASYRLLGYENRLLAKEDFNDDTKDAGELGAGHTVTALYEIELVNETINVNPESSVDPLKYQDNSINKEAYKSGEMLTLKLRYKRPSEDKSRLITQTLRDSGKDLTNSSDNFRWSAAVASWGMILRDSQFKGDASIEQVLELARSAQGPDLEGYRAEFIEMVGRSRKVYTHK
jgi:Ca-activated chloride channel family protein